jgi:rare lipoprotein A
VEVSFPKTNKSTIVRINDRGPYRRGAIIDISMAAAKEIGLVPFGVSKVSIRLIPEIEITDSLRSAWFKKDSLNASFHPFVVKKVSKKKKRRGRKKSKAK